ncbi:pilus assembly protein CpaE [Nakamurella silvestris]|nr:pilus assembly protein CpaE [Nakamurella silvestris]
MIDIDLAVQLRDGGLRWNPSRGDWFAIVGRGMDEEHFVLSDMTIELRGDQIGFNGTTEWALDSVDQDAAVWLPREHQLRELLGGTFGGLDRQGPDWRVHITVSGSEREYRAATPEGAYARALLYLMTGE